MHSFRKSTEYADDSFEQIAVLAVGELAVGIARSALKRLVAMGSVVPCNCGPAWLVGMCELEAEWCLVVGVATMLGCEVRSDSHVIAVVEVTAGRKIGLQVDSVIGFRDIFSSEVTSCGRQPMNTWLTGITRDELLLLDLTRLFEDPALAPDAVCSYFFQDV